ncbi:heparan-alpha-glucosaminide N-acetyltransferase [Pseudoxanthobacter sp.]|uniref:DUF1624 domain-containing protein n=1 Tax=Pseudoxanthobacter sp. TaxID=1925742 RepID=UPI002FE304B9
MTDTAPPATAAPAPRGRLQLLDVLRAAALAAMVVYHFSFDLSFFGFTDWQVASATGWVVFARSIAVSFLFIAGLSLVLANRRAIRPAVVLRRFATIAVAAGLVSLGTYFAVPDEMVRFGILHLIAFGSLAGLAFLRLPPPLTLLAGVLVLVAPVYARSDLFDPRWLLWTGLGYDRPAAMDYVPVFPWFGVMLIGIAAGRVLTDSGLTERLAAFSCTRWPVRAAAFAGRHTLIIYLVHQPLLFGALQLALWLGVTPPAQVANYRTSCLESCHASGGEAARCTAYCDCTAEGFTRAGLWRGAGSSSTAEAAVDGIVRQCQGVAQRLVVPQ